MPVLRGKELKDNYKTFNFTKFVEQACFSSRTETKERVRTSKTFYKMRADSEQEREDVLPFWAKRVPPVLKFEAVSISHSSLQP